jgi:hypothetical protein
MTDSVFNTAHPVSKVVGRWQIPVLTWATRVIFVSAVIGLIVPAAVGTAIRVGVVSVAIAVPLLRVAWLVYRWRQERDWRFVALGLTLLSVIAAGAVLALA